MKKIESGRSMVEMLGVLAIIGVLSVGGIAGYTMAMNKYRANEIISAASQCAILGTTYNAGAGVTSATTCESLGAPVPTGISTSADYKVEMVTVGTVKKPKVTSKAEIDDGVCTAIAGMKTGACASKALAITFDMT